MGCYKPVPRQVSMSGMSFAAKQLRLWLFAGHVALCQCKGRKGAFIPCIYSLLFIGPEPMQPRDLQMSTKK